MKQLYLLILFSLSIPGFTQTIIFTDQNLRVELINAGPFNSTARNANGDFINIDTNNDNQIQVSEAMLVWQLNLNAPNITDMGGIKSFENLRILNMAYSDLVTGDFADMANLEVLNLMNSNGDTNYLNVSGCTALRELICYGSQLTDLDLSNLPALETVKCYQNDLSNINLSGSTNLKSLYIAGNLPLQSIDFTGLVNLETLDLGTCHITSLDVSGLTGLKDFKCYAYELESINLSGLTNLVTADCKWSVASSIDLSGCSSLETFICTESDLQTVNLSGLSSIKRIDCTNSLLESIDVSGLSTLEELGVSQNNLSSINLSGATSLKTMDLYDNSLTVVSLAGLSELVDLILAFNPAIDEIDISGCSKLELFVADFTAISSVDVRHCHNLQHLSLGDMPDLVSVFMKNGSSEQFSTYNVPNLAYICADASEIQYMTFLNIPASCVKNSYCSFTPGGVTYNASGQVAIDTELTGCGSSSAFLSGALLKISDSSDVSYVYANDLGAYNFPLGAGTYMISPLTDNGYFTITPLSASITISEAQPGAIQNFCMAPVGVMPDIEVILLPLVPARPGFDAEYKITYRNKGNTVQNGTVVLNFMDDRIDYVTATPAPMTISGSLLTWGYTALLPFETREIHVTLNINSPMEVPAVSIGDQLDFGAYVYLDATDVFPSDNEFGLKQQVVGSFDPNDKTCLEGNAVTIDHVGAFVHYLIRFENTGTFAAENVVVSDEIDISKFDIESLTPFSASHPYFARITEGNKVEFIFENIDLPFADASNDGYIAFKIKTLPTLGIGDTFSNTASIFFDYNFPVVTNTASTVIQLLGIEESEFFNLVSVHPNPADNVLRIMMPDGIQIARITVFDAVGRNVLVSDKEQIDISVLNSGTYYIKINTPSGECVKRFIKR